MSLRKISILLSTAALATGLLSNGVSASYTDSATAALRINVGSFGCQVSSTDPHAVASGNSVTINLPDILSSASGNYLTDLSVTNTGSIPQLVHWTETTGGTIAWQPTGRMGYAAGTAGDPLSKDLPLAGGAGHTYTGGIGFMWAALINDDIGKSASVTYTANCGEVPAPTQSKVSFVGAANQAGHAALTLPSGAQTGDIVIVEAEGSSAPGIPTGYTSVTTTVAPRTSLSYHILASGETSVPAMGTNALYEEVAVYRGVSGIGAFTYISANANNVGGSSYPMNCTALSLTKTNGSSWVACMGFDGYASTNAKSMVFQPYTLGSPAPCGGTGCTFLAANTSNRSSGLSDAHTGLADTNGGVAGWGPLEGWPGDNFPLPGTHGVTVYSIELLSK